MDGLRYAVIGSGSSANAYIFEYKGFSIIIDNGFSCRELILRASNLGFDVNNVKYLLLTHTHQDHFRGIEVLSKKLKVPVVVHEKLNINQKLKSHLYKRINILPGKEYIDGDLKYKAFYTSHDADYSISFHFKLAKIAFTIITDTGKVTEEMKDMAAASEVLFIEANYNDDMLQKGSYPFFLKERITSQFGHLSNMDAIYFLNEAENRKEATLKKVYFCHLSSTNNSVEILEKDIAQHLKWTGDWVICPKGEPIFCS